MNTKVVVVDPGLLNTHGHHFHTDLAIYQALEARGVETITLGHRDVDADILSVMPVQPTFRASAYPDRDGTAGKGFRANFERFNQWVAEDFAAYGPGLLTADDLILVPTVRDFHLDGIFDWYISLPAPRPRICLRMIFLPNLRVANEDLAFAMSSAKTQMARWADIPEDRLILVAETQELAEYVYAQYGMQAQVFPLVVQYAQDNGILPPAADILPRNFTFLGEARREKGAHLLPDAFAQFQARHPDTHLTVQTSCLFDVGADYPDVLKRRVPHVSLLGEPLTKAAYGAALTSADVMLLPYDAEQYTLRTSMILLEAVGAGKPVIVTQGTWMHRMMLDFGLPDLSVSDYSSAGLCEALQRLMAHWPDMAEKATPAARALRDTHNPDRFVAALLQALAT